MIALMILMLTYAKYASKRENMKAIVSVSSPITLDGPKSTVVVVTMTLSKNPPYVRNTNKSKTCLPSLLIRKIKKYSLYILMKSSKHSSVYWTKVEAQINY